MGTAAVHAQLLGGTTDFHLLFKAFGPRATVRPPDLGTQHLPHEAQARGWPRCPPPRSRCLDDLYGPPTSFCPHPGSLSDSEWCAQWEALSTCGRGWAKGQGPARVTSRPSPVISKGHGPLLSGGDKQKGVPREKL